MRHRACTHKSKVTTAQLKQAVEKGSAEQRQSLQQEHDKAEALAQELSMARAQIYAYEAQARQASDQAADGSAAELRKSPIQEREREARLQQDLAAARRDVEAQTALAAKAADEVGQLKKTADAGTADLRNSLQQERDRASKLEQDLATARRDVERRPRSQPRRVAGAICKNPCNKSTRVPANWSGILRRPATMSIT